MAVITEKSSPCSLIDGQGKPALGVYTSPFGNVNLRDFDYRKVAPFPLSLTSRSARCAIKRWQYMGFVSEELVIGMAVVDISYACNAFVYWYNRVSGELKDFSFLDLRRKHVLFSESSISGITEYVSPAASIRMDNSLKVGTRRAQVSIGDEFSLDLSVDEADFMPLCVVTQNGLRGFNYCHKAAGLPVEGWARIGAEEFKLTAEGASGILDWTAGCAARETFWNWASGGGRLQSGARLGVNFVSGINDRGYTENGYWVDGRPEKVDTVLFDYEPDKILTRPWHITSNDGKVNLTFHPENERAENFDYGAVASRFHQPFGRFAGELEVGGRMEAVSFFGFVEEHEARW